MPTTDEGADVAGPWERPVEDLVTELDSDLAVGLSTDQAQRRLARYGLNELVTAEPTPAWRRVTAQFREPLVVLLLIATAISLVAWLVEGGQALPVDALVIIVIVIANAGLGLWQERRAEAAVAALRRMTETHSRVIRDGAGQTIPSHDLVPGDILALGEGDAVGADARLVQAASLLMVEAPLTGESHAVDKQTETLTGVAVADRTNMVYSGTAVAAGRGVALVTATGMQTEMGRIATLLDQQQERRTPLQQEMDVLGRWLGVGVAILAAVVVAAILATSDIAGGSDVVAVLLIGVSLAVAAVPEGLPAILAVVLALGVQRMAAANAVVKRLSSVETLGSASVICTDKTGTLTRNEMTITRVVTATGSVEVTGTGYTPVGQLTSDGVAVTPGSLLDEVRLVLGGGSLANDAGLSQAADGAWVVVGDPTEAAFLVAEEKLGSGEARRQRFTRVDELPFTSARKMMTTLNTDSRHREADLLAVTKGAPDVVLPRCTGERRAGGVLPLTPARRQQWAAEVDRLAGDALRTLAVAYRMVPTDPAPIDEAPGDNGIDQDEGEHDGVEQELVLLGIVGIIDPPRPEARTAIAEARRAGIRVVAITGDHPVTAHRIAQDVGLFDAEGDAVTGTAPSRTAPTRTAPTRTEVTGAELDGLTGEALDAAVSGVRVFSRVAPEHKLRIIESLQAQGNVVAMTGDGVNDAPALRRADIGVAMGITGTEVSKEAADMILADDDFATLVTGVREGRAIFANIAKFLRYLLASNTGEVLVVFLGIIGAGLIGLSGAGAGLAVPLLATQILWINLLTDTGLALALGVDPQVDDPMQRPPRRMTDRVVDREMAATIALTGLMLAIAGLAALDLALDGGLLGGSGDIVTARTNVFTTVVLGNVFSAFNSRSTSTSAFTGLFANRLLWVAVAVTVLLQVAVVHVGPLNSAFSTVPLSPGEWARCTALASLVLWAEEVRKLILRRRSARLPL